MRASRQRRTSLTQSYGTSAFMQRFPWYQASWGRGHLCPYPGNHISIQSLRTSRTENVTESTSSTKPVHWDTGQEVTDTVSMSLKTSVPSSDMTYYRLSEKKNAKATNTDSCQHWQFQALCPLLMYLSCKTCIQELHDQRCWVSWHYAIKQLGINLQNSNTGRVTVAQASVCAAP